MYTGKFEERFLSGTKWAGKGRIGGVNFNDQLMETAVSERERGSTKVQVLDVLIGVLRGRTESYAF